MLHIAYKSNEAFPIYILKDNDNVVKEPELNGKNPQTEITKNLALSKLENMLTFVNDCIRERTKTITEIIRKQKNSEG